jgi:hypothetical protein
MAASWHTNSASIPVNLTIPVIPDFRPKLLADTGHCAELTRVFKETATQFEEDAIKMFADRNGLARCRLNSSFDSVDIF